MGKPSFDNLNGKSAVTYFLLHCIGGIIKGSKHTWLQSQMFAGHIIRIFTKRVGMSFLQYWFRSA